MKEIMKEISKKYTAIFSCIVIACLFLASCRPVQATDTPLNNPGYTPIPRTMETPVPTEILPENQSPEVICPYPDPLNPTVNLHLNFTDFNNGLVEVETAIRPIPPAPDPEIKYVNTGLDIEIPFYQEGNTVFALNLKTCQVRLWELKKLQQFFDNLDIFSPQEYQQT